MSCDCTEYVFGCSLKAPMYYVAIEDSRLPAPYATPGIDLFTSGSPWQDGQLIVDGSAFVTAAAMVPISYPPRGCEKYPPTSTADPRSEKQWKADLCTYFEVGLIAGTDDQLEFKSHHMVFYSKTVFIDNVQRLVTYGFTGEFTPNRTTGDSPRDLTGPGGGSIWLDQLQIHIDDPSTTRFYRTAFFGEAVDYWNDFTSGVDNNNGSELVYYSKHNILWDGVSPWQVNKSNVYPWDGLAQIAVNCRYFGQDYYCGSTYYPGVFHSADGDTPASGTWSVFRLKYDDGDGRPEVFASDQGVLTSDTIVADHEGPYMIMLWSQRAWLLTNPPEPPEGSFSTLESRTPDEPWAIAMSDSGKIVTGRVFNNRMRTANIYNSDSHFQTWDGTLQDGSDGFDNEVANIIVDPANGSDPAVVAFPDEDWQNPAIRSYVHFNGKDYALLTFYTTAGSTPQTATPLADFGADAGSGDMNHGLSGGLAFESDGDHGDTVDPDHGYFDDDPTFVHHDPDKWAAKFHSTPALVGQVSLVLKDVHVVNNTSAITFDYRLDNRAQSAVFPYSYLGNFPGDDGALNHDTLEFYVDGVLKWSTYNASASSAGDFLNFHPSSDVALIDDIPAGKHTFRWTLKRYTAQNDMAAWIDNIQLPEILVSDDINGVRRYFYDGTRLRRASHWAWPRRDDVVDTVSGDPGHTGINFRASTVPDAIAVDRSKGNEGKILYGNPHYLCRIIVDDIDDEVYPDGKLDEDFGTRGFVRWTATPGELTLVEKPDGAEEPSDDDCEAKQTTTQELLLDPPWGAFHPIPLRGGIQVRGVNSSIADSTVTPVNKHLYGPDEKWQYLTQAATSTAPGEGGWSTRVTGWSVRDNGNTLIPHVDVMWHPIHDQPAFPVGPDTDTYPASDGYQAPPFPFSMQADSHVLRDNATGRAISDPTALENAYTDFCRVRDPRKIGVERNGEKNWDTRKPVWNVTNYVTPRVYSDCYSFIAQYHWIKKKGDDPVDGDDPNYLIYPYPSVQWFLAPVYASPIPGMYPQNGQTDNTTGQCPMCQSDDPLAPGYDPDCDPDNWHYTFNTIKAGPATSSGSMGNKFDDFDAVDCDCDCCVENDFVNPRNAV
jgi:hypothetical protein